MDLKRPENKVTLIDKIKTLANDIRTFLIVLVNQDHHKAALMYYWLRNYLQYIKQEEAFDAKYFPAFQPGHIVKVDFGFGIGNEFGGLHYAIVLSPSSNKSGMVTVVPLRSLKPHKEKPTTLYKTDIYLGSELFTVLFSTAGKLLDTCSAEVRRLENIEVGTLSKSQLHTLTEQIESAHKMLIKHEIIMKEVARLNSGTVAVASQVRTVSKIRIQNPTCKQDALFNMRVEKHVTDKIRQALKEIHGIK